MGIKENFKIVRDNVIGRFTKKHIDDGEVDDSAKTNQGLDENESVRPIWFNKVDVNNPAHRFAQMKANPVAVKHTTGLANKLLGKRPIPFIYVAKDHLKTQSVEPLPAMDYAHDLWTDDRMFKILEKVFAEALGVNSAFIFKMKDETFKVFNRSHIKDENYWREPGTRKLVAIKVKWKGGGGGKSKGSNVDLSTPSLMGYIGENTVMCQPYPSVQNVFGKSSLLGIWSMIIYKMRNKFYNFVVNKKGGIASRELLIPDNVSTTWYKRFEKEALKGVESELITIKYPTALGTTDPSKFVDWQENHVGPTNYKEFDDMMSNDSPIPPSWMDGPQTGSLGGVNANIDDMEIDEIIRNYFSLVEQTIKEINQTFYGIEPNYAIIPYLEPKDEKIELDAVGNEIEDKKDNPSDKDDNTPATNKEKSKDIKKNEKMNIKKKTIPKTHSMKFHSVATENGQYVYEGNLWEEGWYNYGTHDNPELEYLPKEEIMKFIDDPKSILDGYVSIEHLEGTIVPKHLSIAKYETYGYGLVDGLLRDKTKVYFPFDPMVDEMDVSPVYDTLDIKRDGNIIQTELDLRNVGITTSPRSSLTGKVSKIKRVEKNA